MKQRILSLVLALVLLLAGCALRSVPEAALNSSTLEFSRAGETFALRLVPAPAQKTAYRSSNPAVAAVDADGVVTAVAPGRAEITVECGEITAVCRVSCEFAPAPESEPTEPPLFLADGLKLSRTDITFFNAGENIYLHVDNLPNGYTVTWRSDNITVAVVDQSGHVVASGEGTCRITATVGDVSASCIVRCRFD